MVMPSSSAPRAVAEASNSPGASSRPACLIASRCSSSPAHMSTSRPAEARAHARSTAQACPRAPRSGRPRSRSDLSSPDSPLPGSDRHRVLARTGSRRCGRDSPEDAGGPGNHVVGQAPSGRRCWLPAHRGMRQVPGVLDVIATPRAQARPCCPAGNDPAQGGRAVELGLAAVGRRSTLAQVRRTGQAARSLSFSRSNSSAEITPRSRRSASLASWSAGLAGELAAASWT